MKHSLYAKIVKLVDCVQKLKFLLLQIYLALLDFGVIKLVRKALNMQNSHVLQAISPQVQPIQRQEMKHVWHVKQVYIVKVLTSMKSTALKVITAQKLPSVLLSIHAPLELT